VIRELSVMKTSLYRMNMRFWAFFAGKFLAASAASYGLFAAVYTWWPQSRNYRNYEAPAFAQDLGYTLAIGVCFLVASGLLYLCVWDQRYRCRVCLRRLRMPIETGSWSRMLQFGRPETEYICTYGHGKLNVAQVQISGSENPAWTPQPDMWTELTGAGKTQGYDGDASGTSRD
ncbi:MAG: hypothetical protein ABIZ80_21680, partial [Bryobacteraceae bacterium]